MDNPKLKWVVTQTEALVLNVICICDTLTRTDKHRLQAWCAAIELENISFLIPFNRDNDK